MDYLLFFFGRLLVYSFFQVISLRNIHICVSGQVEHRCLIIKGIQVLSTILVVKAMIRHFRSTSDSIQGFLNKLSVRTPHSYLSPVSASNRIFLISLGNLLHFIVKEKWHTRSAQSLLEPLLAYCTHTDLVNSAYNAVTSRATCDFKIMPAWLAYLHLLHKSIFFRLNRNLMIVITLKLSQIFDNSGTFEGHIRYS